MERIEAMARAICAAESIDPDMEVFRTDLPCNVSDYIVPKFAADGFEYQQWLSREQADVVPAWTAFTKHANEASEALKRATFEDQK